MAMARMNVPGIFVYAGTIKPGTWKGQTLTIVSPFEAVGSFTAGKMSEEDLVGIEFRFVPAGLGHQIGSHVKYSGERFMSVK